MINCMLLFVLNNQIPYSVFYLQRDLYPIPLCVFGCTCFVNDLTQVKINSLLSPLNVFFVVILASKKDIFVFVLHLNSILSLVTSPSLSLPLSSRHPLLMLLFWIFHLSFHPQSFSLLHHLLSSINKNHDN